MQDRRRCYRLDTQLPVTFQASKFQQHVSVGISQNISATGLCFTSTDRVDKGQDLVLEVRLPPGEKVKLNTEVVWVRDAGTISRDYLIGVRLKEPVDDNARKFIRFCARKMNEGLGKKPAE